MSEKYSKSTFNRFGDDLSQLILSHLPFEDRIRKEFVCKQFSQLVYAKQYTFEINEILFKKLQKTDNLGHMTIDLRKYKVFVKKLTNLKTLDIEYDPNWCEFSKFVNLIDITLKQCKRLDEIYVAFSLITHSQANEFFKKFGPKIKILRFGFIKQLFEGKNICLVKGLTTFSFIFNNFEVQEYFTKFVEIYKSKLQCLCVAVPKNIELTSMKFLFKQITLLKNLTKLVILFLKNPETQYQQQHQHQIPILLNEIGEKCSSINELKIRFLSKFSNTENLFKSIGKFKNLTKLHIALFIDDDYEMNLMQYLVNCKNLREFILMSIGILYKDDFFFEIHKKLPKIQKLSIYQTDITEVSFVELSRLKHLQRLLLNSKEIKTLSKNTIYDLVKSCPSLEDIHLENFEFSSQPAINDQEIISCKNNLRKLKIETVI